MALLNIFKSCPNKPGLSSTLIVSACNSMNKDTGILCSTSLISMQTRGIKTKKRRCTHPFKWWAKKDAPKHYRFMDRTNQRFVEDIVAKQKELSPLKHDELMSQEREWTPESIRSGLIAKKIGIVPYWTKDGKRGLATVLQVKDNHVIKAYTAEQYKDMVIIQNRWKWDGFGCLIVGTESDDPQNFTAQYSGLFTEAGVLPKRQITNMLVTDDALMLPGTPLTVKHFRVGEWVTCFGKTRDWGFQGVMARWHFKGLPAQHGVTKAHNRPGSISRGRKASGPWKGKKMPGHEGSERRGHFSCKIIRIDYRHQLLFIKGPAIPGIIGSWLYVYDSKNPEKRHTIENPPPFPTHFEDEKEVKVRSSATSSRSRELGDQELGSEGQEDATASHVVKHAVDEPQIVYSAEIHQFDAPTIVFKEDPSEKKVIRTGAKLAKVRTKN